jgi:hypothetical protein
MFWGNEERHRLLLEKMEAIEIWGHIKDHEDIREERNNFWYGHPVYFINHLERAGLLRHPRIDELLAVQDRVVKLACLQKGARGMYGINIDDSRRTFCNHAVFLTIQAVDENYKSFTGGINNPPDSPGDGYEYRASNWWCDVLVTQSEKADSGIVRLLDGKQAQEIANEGYVVICAWKNTKKKTETGNISPHFATVRPYYSYNSENGPQIANVGETNNADTTARDGFGENRYSDIKYYYNRNQKFPVKVFTGNIEKLEAGKYL